MVTQVDESECEDGERRKTDVVIDISSDSEHVFNNNEGETDCTAPKLKSSCSIFTGDPEDEEFLFVVLECADCEDLFPTCKELLLHRLEVHSDRKAYQCPACLATYKRPDLLEEHKRTHTNEVPHACMNCGQRFTLRAHVVSHAARHSRHASVHRGPTHANAHALRCSVCPDRVFQSAGGLASHMRCHSEERPFICEVCNEGFKHRSTLMKHAKRTHPTL